MGERTLVIDNFDSFTHILADSLAVASDGEVLVRRNNELSVAEVVDYAPTAVVLSPGPGGPQSMGVSRDALLAMIDEGCPVLGVCLGMQLIADVHGGVVRHAREPRHGVPSRIRHRGEGLFAGVPDGTSVMRYHSLAVERGSLLPEIVVTAEALDDDEVMAIELTGSRVFGVQFHPESYRTECGMIMLRNFFATIASSNDRHARRAA